MPSYPSDPNDPDKSIAPSIASHPDPTSPEVLPPSPTYPAGTPSHPIPDNGPISGASRGTSQYGSPTPGASSTGFSGIGSPPTTPATARVSDSWRDYDSTASGRAGYVPGSMGAASSARPTSYNAGSDSGAYRSTMSATYSGSGSSPSSSSGYSDTRAGPTSSAIEGAADGLADGLEREDIGGNVHGALSQIDEALEDRPSPRAQRLRTRLERIDEKVETIIDKTKVRARAVAETARRARDAPPKVAGDLTDAAKTYATGIAANVGFAIAAAFIGLLALTVLTVGMVQGLNDAWGAPRGTFLVAGAYFLVAFALYSTGKGRARRAQLKARAHLLDAKGEIQRVARPMQRAFAGDMDAEHRGVAASRPERPIRQRDGFDLERQRTPDPSLSVKPYRGGPH